MKRKLASILLALLLIFSAAACGGNGAKPAQGTDSKAEVPVTTGDDGREMEGNLYLTGLPLVKEQETFTIFCDDSGLPEEKVAYQIFEEQTNVKVNLMLMPYEAAKAKLNVLLNSGDYPDVIGGWLLNEKDIMTMGMNEGVFIALDGLFQKYAPKVEEVINLEGVRETMTLPDGHIYTIPYVAGEPLTTFNPWINDVWLKKLGLTMPATTDELKEVLIAFRDKDPNGNGLKDEIPFSCDPDNLHIGIMAGYFGVDVSGWNQPRYFTMIDGKPVFGGTQEAFKEFMIWFADLYKEKLVDPEMFTQDKAQWRAKGNSNLYGVSIAYGSGEFAVKDETPGRDWTLRRTEYEPLPVLKSNYTDKPTFRRQTYEVAKDSVTGNPVGVTTFRTQAVITDKAKNPATIARYYDNLFQLENSLTANNGPLGIRWEKLADGQYRDIDEETLSQEVKDTYGWPKVYTQSMPKYIPAGYSILPPEGKSKEYDEYSGRDALYAPFLGERMPKAWVSEDVAQRSAILQTDIEAYMKKTIAEWATGQKDVKAEWENHLKALNDLGLPELQKIVEDSLATVK